MCSPHATNIGITWYLDINGKVILEYDVGWDSCGRYILNQKEIGYFALRASATTTAIRMSLIWMVSSTTSVCGIPSGEIDLI